MNRAYSDIVKDALEYIEEHFLSEISADEIASHIAISKWHFQRIFVKETGFTIAEYLRKRRLTNAAQQLIWSKARIIDIAYEHHFSTQESFTRAFKMMFHLPPAQYRANFKLFKEEIGLTQPKGWFLSGDHPHEYELGVDLNEVHVGKASGFIQSVGSCTADGFATMMQVLKAEQYLGERIRFSGFIKSENVSGWVGMWMRVDSKDGETVSFDNMENRSIKGTKQWNQYSIVLDIPKFSDSISFGILLSGPGKAWVDGLSFQEVDESIEVTDIMKQKYTELSDEPINLNFEEF